MKCFSRLVVEILVFGSSIAHAQQGCLDSDPLPASPAATSETVSFNASFGGTSRDQVRLDLWRLSCAPNPSRLFLRATPLLGNTSVCGVDFTVIQAGTQYGDIVLAQNGSGTSTFCGDMFVPTTFRLMQYSSAPQFNRDLALRLIYKGVFGNTFGDLPAANTSTPAPITPAVGVWWNPNESGSGYTIDVKHGVLVMIVFSYKTNGAVEWYYVSGPLTDGGRKFTGSLDRFAGGQCISCAYNGRPTYAGSDGTITIEFSSATSATLTLPSGRVTNIEPQPF